MDSRLPHKIYTCMEMTIEIETYRERQAYNITLFSLVNEYRRPIP